VWIYPDAPVLPTIWLLSHTIVWKNTQSRIPLLPNFPLTNPSLLPKPFCKDRTNILPGKPSLLFPRRHCHPHPYSREQCPQTSGPRRKLLGPSYPDPHSYKLLDIPQSRSSFLDAIQHPVLDSHHSLLLLPCVPVPASLPPVSLHIKTVFLDRVPPPPPVTSLSPLHLSLHPTPYI